MALYTILFIKKGCYLMGILWKSMKQTFHSYMVVRKSSAISVSGLPSVVSLIITEAKVFQVVRYGFVSVP